MTTSPAADWSGRRVTVMGLGQFGGGLAAVRYLLERGARVTLTDLRDAQQLQPALDRIPRQQLENLVLGEHREIDFTSAEVLVVNPAVKPGNRFVELARIAGAALTSEMNLFWQACPARKIVVTGSVGKSTTVTLLHQCLRELGFPAWLGGNIGISLLPQVDQMTTSDWVVLELSSFQLADLARQHPAPDIAIVTNLHPNHLDWHGTLEHYRNSKQTAVRWQSAEQFAVLNADDLNVRNWTGAGEQVWFGEQATSARIHVQLLKNELKISGAHSHWQLPLNNLAPNLQAEHMLPNVAAALAAVECALTLQGQNPSEEDILRRVCQEFQSLPHRFNRVAEVQGRVFINDSKATTPEAALAALAAVKQPVWLIAGGKDKGVDLQPFAQAAAQSRGVALLGETAALLEGHLRRAGSVPVLRCDSLRAAILWAWNESRPGDAILLSPGCASDGEFQTFEQRGNAFQVLVRELEIPGAYPATPSPTLPLKKGRE